MTWAHGWAGQGCEELETGPAVGTGADGPPGGWAVGRVGAGPSGLGRAGKGCLLEQSGPLHIVLSFLN